jgi:rhodanese-related sulfurtransferase
MKKRTLAGLILALAMFVPLAAAFAADDKEEIPFPEVPRISAEEVKAMIDKGAPPILVDTRDTTSYDAGHIKGAVNIYYDPAGDPQEREMTLVALPMDKMIVIYCPCQNEEDSAPLVMELWKLGYDRDKVKALQGGSLRWEALKYPLVETGK